MLFSFASSFVKIIPLFYIIVLLYRDVFIPGKKGGIPFNEEKWDYGKAGKKNQLLETRNCKLFNMILCGLDDSLMTWMGSGSGGRTTRSQHGFLHANGIRMSKDEKIAREVGNRSSFLSCNEDKCKWSNQMSPCVRDVLYRAKALLYFWQGGLEWVLYNIRETYGT